MQSLWLCVRLCVSLFLTIFFYRLYQPSLESEYNLWTRSINGPHRCKVLLLHQFNMPCIAQCSYTTLVFPQPYILSIINAMCNSVAERTMECWKYLLPTQVLCLLTAVSMASSTRNLFSFSHPPLILGPRIRRDTQVTLHDAGASRSVKRSEIGTSGSCVSSADLHARLDSIVCSSTYLKSLASAGDKCNLFGYFDSDHIRGCGRDKNGTYCRQHERNFPDPDYMAWDVLQQCSLPSRSCSSSCRSALKSFAGKFGCCIHVSRVSWFVEDNPHILILSSALWSFCGLQRPEPCSNIHTPTSASIAGPCTYGCYAYARSALICETIGKQLIDTYTTCGRQGSGLELGQLCGLNNRGKACFELQFSDNTDYLLSVYSACFDYFSSSSCPKKCRKALQQFRSRYGCCVNVYNGTAFGESSQLLGSLVTTYELWAKCGVETPGLCELPTNVGNSTYNITAFCDSIMSGAFPIRVDVFSHFVSLLCLVFLLKWILWAHCCTLQPQVLTECFRRTRKCCDCHAHHPIYINVLSLYYKLIEHSNYHLILNRSWFTNSY